MWCLALRCCSSCQSAAQEAVLSNPTRGFSTPRHFNEIFTSHLLLSKEQQRTSVSAFKWRHTIPVFWLSFLERFTIRWPMWRYKQGKQITWITWSRMTSSYRQIFYVWRQRCFSAYNWFHWADSQSPVYSVDQIYPPFPRCSMCFLEDILADNPLQKREKHLKSSHI